MFNMKWRCRGCKMLWSQHLINDSNGIPTCPNASCAGTCDPVIKISNIATATSSQAPTFVNVGSLLDNAVKTEFKKVALVKHRKIRWES
jgi:hypothetical protein